MEEIGDNENVHLHFHLDKSFGEVMKKMRVSMNVNEIFVIICTHFCSTNGFFAGLFCEFSAILCIFGRMCRGFLKIHRIAAKVTKAQFFSFLFCFVVEKNRPN